MNPLARSFLVAAALVLAALGPALAEKAENPALREAQQQRQRAIDESRQSAFPQTPVLRRPGFTPDLAGARAARQPSLQVPRPTTPGFTPPRAFTP